MPIERTDKSTPRTIFLTQSIPHHTQAYIYARENSYGPNDWQKCLTVPNIGNLQYELCLLIYITSIVCSTYTKTIDGRREEDKGQPRIADANHKNTHTHTRIQHGLQPLLHERE